MTKREKLLQKVRNNPKHVSLSDLESLLDSYGFVRRELGPGSHRYYSRPGGYAVLVPAPHKRAHVKTVYVRDVLRLIEQIDEQESEGSSASE